VTREPGVHPRSAARRSSASSGSTERGSASLLVVTMAGLLVFVGAALAGVTGLVVDHRRAQAAADLAALAGATVAEDPCGAAARIAAANGDRLTACSPTGADVVVTVEVTSAAWPRRAVTISATSRAGPA
jgi:secretion/DNA translocation related TadE-like protein